VIKAAGSTALSILVLGRLIKKPGFPPGVVNILNCYGKEVGAAMVQQELVCKVAFTGSSGTASQIMKTASAPLRNITLETGEESHLPVFSDADLEQAVRWSHMGIDVKPRPDLHRNFTAAGSPGMNPYRSSSPRSRLRAKSETNGKIRFTKAARKSPIPSPTATSPRSTSKNQGARQ
jgi:hypothetical protein